MRRGKFKVRSSRFEVQGSKFKVQGCGVGRTNYEFNNSKVQIHETRNATLNLEP
jgi:hypothetical protein